MADTTSKLEILPKIVEELEKKITLGRREQIFSTLCKMEASEKGGENLITVAAKKGHNEAWLRSRLLFGA